MKAMKYRSILMLMVAMLPAIVSCGSDDEEPADINSYIIGYWHSSYFESFANGQSAKGDIDKTGAASSAYFEFTFNSDGKVKMGGWQTDSSGLSKWMEEEGSYTILGNIVRITDAEGQTADLLFDGNQRTLCLHVVGTWEGMQVTVNVYLRK